MNEYTIKIVFVNPNQAGIDVKTFIFSAYTNEDALVMAAHYALKSDRPGYAPTQIRIAKIHKR